MNVKGNFQRKNTFMLKEVAISIKVLLFALSFGREGWISRELPENMTRNKQLQTKQWNSRFSSFNDISRFSFLVNNHFPFPGSLACHSIKILMPFFLLLTKLKKKKKNCENFYFWTIKFFFFFRVIKVFAVLLLLSFILPFPCSSLLSSNPQP